MPAASPVRFRPSSTPVRHAVLCALATLASAPVFAQSTPAQPEAVEQLGTVVVTASGFEQDVTEAPASISVITREDLEQRFYRDVHDALKDVPGVIITGGGDRQDISLRGMESQYTLILIDGKRQSSRETRTNSDSGGVEGGWTPPIAAIERIEVVRGPMSSLYGSDAMGGVINIITRKIPERWGGEVRLDTTLQGHARSGNLYQGNFYLAGPIQSDLLALSLYGQYTKRNEDKIFNGYREREATNLHARLAFTPNRDHDFMLEAGMQRQNYHSTLGKTVEPVPPPCPRTGCPATSSTEYRNTTTGISHTGRWAFGTTDTWLKHETFDNRSRDMKIRNLDFQTSATSPLGESHVFTAGLTYSHQKLDDRDGNQLTTGINNISRRAWAVFAEDEWYLVDNFSLTGGLRMDHDENYGNNFSPRLYGVWQAAEAWTVKGGVSTGFRAPNLRQTVAGWGQVSRGGNMYGNPDLKPEKSVNYELGTLYTGASGISAGATVFYNDFKDKITRIACPLSQCTDGPNQFGSNPTTYLNVDKAVTRGIEANLTLPLSAAWSLKGNYTFTHSEQKSGPNEGQPLNQLPRHMVHLTLGYAPTERLDSWLRVNYRGRESQPVAAASGNSVRAPSYTFVDFGGSYRYTNDITLYAGVYNLFDKQVTYDDYGYIEDGRRYWLGMGVPF